MKRNDKNNEDKGNKGEDRGGNRGFQKRRGCRFCIEPGLVIDYKDKYLLQNFVSERFKITPRRVSGLCASHQRGLTNAIKKSRHVAVLSYSTAQV